MIKVFQNHTVVNDGYGTCFNACICSILELPSRQVEHIYPSCPGSWIDQWRIWLADHGLKMVHASLSNPPKGYSIATVYTERNYPEGHKNEGSPIAHAIVAFNGELVHDPYPLGSKEVIFKYYTELKPLNDAERHLHELKIEQGGRCIHGYRVTCTYCNML